MQFGTSEIEIFRIGARYLGPQYTIYTLYSRSAAIFPLVFEKCKVQFSELSEAPSMKVVPKGDCLEEQRDMK